VLQVADAGELLVELVPVIGAELGPQRADLAADVVEDAPVVLQAADLGL
jgi:hypothetical protein